MTPEDHAGWTPCCFQPGEPRQASQAGAPEPSMLWMTTYIGGSAGSSRMLCRIAWLLPLLHSQGQAVCALGATQNASLECVVWREAPDTRKHAADLCTPGQPSLPKLSSRLNK